MSLHLTRPPEPRLSIRDLPMQARALWRAMVAARRERLEMQQAHRIFHERQKERQRIGVECLGTSIRSTTGNHGRTGPR